MEYSWESGRFSRLLPRIYRRSGRLEQ
jgi:hypothetical protein